MGQDPCGSCTLKTTALCYRSCPSFRVCHLEFHDTTQGFQPRWLPPDGQGTLTHNLLCLICYVQKKDWRAKSNADYEQRCVRSFRRFRGCSSAMFVVTFVIVACYPFEGTSVDPTLRFWERISRRRFIDTCRCSPLYNRLGKPLDAESMSF